MRQQHHSLRSIACPLNYMKTSHPLEGQSLSKLQEELRHIRYILIDEMSFIGPKMLTQIDACLHQALPLQSTIPFGGCSIILLGDFRQLPFVKYIPMYAGSSVGTALWHTFDTFIMLEKNFRQAGNSSSQTTFQQFLLNLRNATTIVEYWALLMTRTTSCLSFVENSSFEQSIHFHPTNSSIALHNKHMMKQLNMPITHCFAEQRNKNSHQFIDEEQLGLKVLLVTSSLFC